MVKMFAFFQYVGKYEILGVAKKDEAMIKTKVYDRFFNEWFLNFKLVLIQLNTMAY